MRFQPKTEEEIAVANLLIGGDYPFEVVNAEEQTSKAGNDMVKLRLNVINAEDRGHTIFDYLVGTEGAAYKLRHFAESVGLLAEYERGEMTADQMVGRSGTCQVGIQKDKSGQYPDKNVIRDYVVPKKNGNGADKPKSAKDDFDSEIPF